ncbi:MAG: hypothetical protein IKF05_02680 [Erysipelotrichaceae bacterium]|nr:hypothetical protein [Erysipelotrichaceae bacterium]
MKKLGCFGSSCIDYYTNPQGGKAFIGGGPLNSAVHASGKGIHTAFLSAVGSDAYGMGYQRVLERYQIDGSRLHVIEGKSALCEVTLDGNERLLGDYEEGVYASFSLDAEDIAFLQDCDMLLTDYWGHQEKHFHALRQNGAKLAFDAADQAETVSELLPEIDILFFSGSGVEDLENKMTGLYKSGPSLVVATLGENGSIAYDGCFTRGRAVPCEKVVDTLGAGDSFIGAFLAAYLNNEPVSVCLEKAAKEASSTLAYYGAFPQEGCL